MQIRDRVKELRRVPAGELRPNPKNWRTHPPAQQDALKGILAEVGFADALLAREMPDGSLQLLDGHLRAETTPDLSVPVLILDLNDEEADKLLATLDPLAGLAGVDPEKLTGLLSEIRTDSAGLRELFDGIRPPVVKEGLTDPDAIPEPPEEPITRAGDIWTLGDHRLLCGDSTNAEDVARLLGGGTPALLVTDPPYGVELDPTWRDGVFNKLGPGAKPYMRMEGHGNKTLSGDTVADWSPAFALVPSLEIAYVWHAGVYACEVGEGLRSIGFRIRSQIIWAKTMFAMGRSTYHWQHEPCWYAVKDGCTGKWIGPRELSTLWSLASPKMIMGGSTEDKWDHPAQKPIECMQRPIEHHEGDVYEPFSGSGTTIIGAERVGRRCYAMEIEPRYVDVAVRRWEQFTGKNAARA